MQERRGFPSTSQAHDPPKPWAQDLRASPEPVLPQHPCSPREAAVPHPEPGRTPGGVPFQMGWLTGPHPLSLASLRTQVGAELPGRCGSLSPGHAPPPASRRRTCSGARGRHGHPSHLTPYSFRGTRSPASSARAPPALCPCSDASLPGFSEKPFKRYPSQVSHSVTVSRV